MRKLFCDYCENEIENEEFNVEIYTSKSSGQRSVFCKKCYKDLINKLKKLNFQFLLK